MNEPTPRFWNIFFEVFEALPRQGPGNRACTARALGLCRQLPSAPVVLDLGCGVGGQTLHLADLTAGHIVAADTHRPGLERLSRAVARHGLSARVWPVAADMSHPPFSVGSFGLIWSEGAFYNIGIEPALRVCRPLLQPGGYLAFSDAVWLTENPPAGLRETFDRDYPTMGRVADVVATVGRCDFELLGHFTLPREAWWDDFYTPMLRRVEELRGTYAADREALAILEEIGQEPESYREHAEHYAYEFFVARRNG